jgi:citrate synthase
VLNATLVAIAEHGLVPSVQARRMTCAAAPDALQGAVAAGILGCGSVILGASETAGRMFVEIDEAQAQRRRPARRRHGGGRGAAREEAADPGYGHPSTSSATRGSTRCSRARRAGGGQHFVESPRRWKESSRHHRQGPEAQRLGRDPAVLLGVGFPVDALQGRADPGAHRQPDRPPQRGKNDPIGFALSYQAMREFEYTGELPKEGRAMIKVLEGVRVLEHGTFITGPAASMLLADLGADVVKVELPGTGDPFRAFKGGSIRRTTRRSTATSAASRSTPGSRRPGEVRRAGEGGGRLHPELPPRLRRADRGRLRAAARLNPRLIYCAISGFGASGPRRTGPPTTAWRRPPAATCGCW